MACFTVPLVESVVVTAVEKAERRERVIQQNRGRSVPVRQ